MIKLIRPLSRNQMDTTKISLCIEKKIKTLRTPSIAYIFSKYEMKLENFFKHSKVILLIQ